jgi:hypothetical protein
VFCNLREARLVAVDRRKLEQPRQEGEQRDDNQQESGARVRGHGVIDHGRQAQKAAGAPFARGTDRCHP